MRGRYLVSYDISNAKRWRRVFRTMKGFGAPLHYSVFQCDLVPADHDRMLETLSQEIDRRKDRVMVVHLGPSRGRGRERIEALGRECESKLDDQYVVVV